MVDNKFFFIPSESSRLYDLSALQREAIEASVLQEKLKNIKALKQLIVMDACQSAHGSVLRTGPARGQRRAGGRVGGQAGERAGRRADR